MQAGLRILFSLFALIFASVLMGISGMMTIARQAQPQSPGITFVSNNNGDVELYRVRSDGQYPRQITTDYDIPYAPALSPDGETLAFVAAIGAPPTVFLTRINGSKPVLLTTASGYNLQPDWSPDGQWIAYASNSAGSYEIYRIRVDGSERQRMTQSVYSDWNPAWSPDGAWIAFESNRDGNREIFVISADSEVQDTSGAALGELRTEDEFGTGEIFEERRNQQEIISGERLTDSPAHDWNPAWSPDGKWITFVSDRDGNWEIYRMRVDGSDVKRLSYDDSKDHMPVWSPDGRWIAFVSDRSGTWDIYVMRDDGSNVQSLTHDDYANIAPVWSPIVDMPFHPITLSSVALGLFAITGIVFPRLFASDKLMA